MKYLFSLIIVLLISVSTYAQFDVRAGMGIQLVNNPSLTDYINQNYADPSNRLSSFNTAIIFSAEVDYHLNEKYQMGLETAYLINSFNYNVTGGNYDLSYGIVMPTLTAYYVLSGKGYNFKFGGGVGPRFTIVDQTSPQLSVSQTYTSTGFGFLLRADGNTLLSDNLYANIGADLRYDFNGEPKKDGNYIVNPVYNENVNLNTISIGLRLGITYQF